MDFNTTQIKAPAALSYRGDEATLTAERDTAVAFMKTMITQITETLREESKDHDIDPEYWDFAEDAVARKVQYSLGYVDRYRNAPRMHTWVADGSFRAVWGTTVMVIRKNGTVNTEYLTHMIHGTAWREYEGAKAQDHLAHAEVQYEELGRPGEEYEGYQIELKRAAPKDGIYMATVRTEGMYTAKLTKDVRLTDIETLIKGHRAWVAVLNNL